MTDWIVGSGLLILLMLLIRRLFRSRISSRMRYALWGLVLIRLLCPAGIWDKGGTADYFRTQLQYVSQQRSADRENKDPARDRMTADRVSGEADGAEDMDGSGGAAVPAESDGGGKDSAYGSAAGENGQAAGAAKYTAGTDAGRDTGSEAAAEKAAEIQVSESAGLLMERVGQIWTAVWLAGALAGMVWILLVNGRFYLWLRENRKPAACCERLGALAVYRADGLRSPCLFGPIRPAVYLTEEVCRDPDALSMVLAHESCHYRHGDQIWVLMRAICIAVWWWNPLVWLAAVTVRKDCETACDEGALEQVGWERRFCYAKTLVDLAAGERRMGAGGLAASTMASGKEDMKGRLCMIMKRTEKNAVSMALAAALMISGTAFCFGGETAADSRAGALPVLAAEGDYGVSAVTDGVEAFCEQAGILNSADICRTTPEFMEGTGVELFEDHFNNRMYLSYEGTVMTIPDSYSWLQDSIRILSTALADLDEDGVYEIYLTARAGGRLPGVQDAMVLQLTGTVRLADMAFGWSGMPEPSEGHVWMLTKAESGELVYREALEEAGAEEGTLILYRDEAPDAEEHPVTPAENLSLNPGVQRGLTYSDLSISADLDGSGWLIPEDGPRWGASEEELLRQFGEAYSAEETEDGQLSLRFEDVSLFGYPADLTAAVSENAGLVGLTYEIDLFDLNAVYQEVSGRLGTTAHETDKETGAEGHSWEGICAGTLEQRNQKSYRELCIQRGTLDAVIPEEPLVTAQLRSTDAGAVLTFRAKEEAVLLYRGLCAETAKQIEAGKEAWKRACEQAGGRLEEAPGNMRFQSPDPMASMIVVPEGETDGGLWELALTLLEKAVPDVRCGFGADSLTLNLKAKKGLYILYAGSGDIMLMAGAREDGSGSIVFMYNDGEITQEGALRFDSDPAGLELYRQIMERYAAAEEESSIEN